MNYPICASCGKILEKDKSPFAARGIIPPLYTGVICNKCGKIECVDCKTDKMDAPCSWCGGDVSPAFEHKLAMAQNIERKIEQLHEQAGQLYQEGRHEEALKLGLQAYNFSLQYLGQEHPGFVKSLNNLAFFYNATGNYEKAELIYRQTVEIARKVLGENHPNFSASLHNLIILYKSIGKYAEAEILYRQVIEIERRVLGEDHPNLAKSLLNLATLYQRMGRYSEAEPLYCQTIETRRKILGVNHPKFLANVHNLAELYRLMGKYEKAEPLYLQTIESYRKILGKNHPDFATSLHNLALLYKEMGKYDEAEPLYHQSLEIYRSVLGENHEDFANNLDNLAGLYEAVGNYKESEPLYQKALEIRCRMLGKEHPDVATSLNNLAILYESMGKYTDAELFILQALEIRRKILGENHPDFAASLNNLAKLYQSIGKYSEAEPLYCQALEIERQVLGENHLNVATSLNNLAMLYGSMGRYGEAEPLYCQALEINRRALGENHPDFAGNLNNLAMLYVSTGRYTEAEQLHRQALEIKRKKLGENHPDIAISVHNLALLYDLMGKYADAESLYHQALEIIRNTRGENHPDVAKNLDCLARLYMSLGRYKDSETLFCGAIEIIRDILGENHPELAIILNNLAGLYHKTGNYKEAEQLWRQALNIIRKTVNVEHPEFAKNLSNLASVYQLMGKYKEAEQLHDQALEILGKVLGTKHPDFATSLEGLAGLYDEVGNYGKAESLYHQVLDTREELLGKEHPYYAISLSNLAGLEVSIGRYKDALAKMLEASRIHDRMIAQMFSISNEKQLQKYIETFQNGYFMLLSHFSQQYDELTSYTPFVLDVILKRKALTLEITALRRDIILAHKSPHIKVKFDNLRNIRITMSHLINEGSKETSPKHYQERIHALEQQIETLEKELAAQVPQVELQKKLEHAEHNAIANLLPQDAMLVEFVWYNLLDFKQKRFLKPRYLVFLLSHHADIHVVDLGEASEIDTLITQYRREIMEHGGRNIGIVPSQKEEPAMPAVFTGLLLYERLFRPIVDKIGDTKRLILSPDGPLTLLPFEILPQPNDRYVIEDFEISYVDSGRDLLRFQYRDTPQSHPLILADPDFDLAGFGRLPDTTSVAGRRCYDLDKMLRERNHSQEAESYSFPRLVGTREEGKRIHAFFKGNADLWMRERVLDATIKQIQGPQILHIATHGFFILKRTEEEEEVFRQLGIIEEINEQDIFRGKRYANPLLRSGLALTGINAFFQGKMPAEGAEDGMLTALDVTGMDLIGTDLVVLSACDTGLGEVQTGEGVYGLRRAFTIAGARTLILSLWSIPDEETKELMVNVYTKILHGAEKAKALREAQREMITKLRSQGKPASPYFWGAFICVGDPGKMDELGEKRLKAHPVDSVSMKTNVIPFRRRENMSMKCVCAHCGRLNENIGSPINAMSIPFYAQTEEETKEQPGAYNMKHTCHFCSKEFYIVWEIDPR